jgi:hypothetical protein
MKRLALGFFHFNVQCHAGDLASYHRYVRTAIHPFLSLVRENEQLRITFEIAGSGLEFLRDFHPQTLRLLRMLIERGQLELVSSLYTPNIWVAFPARDLLKSIQINRRCLRHLNLPCSRVFFAQEAFFGEGLRVVSDEFDYAVCKDEYLDYLYGLEDGNGLFQLGDLKVLVASNHILNEFGARLTGDQASKTPVLAPPYRRYLQSGERGRPQPMRTRFCNRDDVSWYWYHCGDGNHFATSAPPSAWEKCFVDDSWLALSRWFFGQVSKEGYEFESVSRLMSSLDLKDLPSFSTLIEGSWNTRRSDGVFQWMGRQANPWERDGEILSLITRTRKEVVRCERLFEELPSDSSQERPREMMEDLWKGLLIAESSDPLGWFPSPNEVHFAVNACQVVTAGVDQFTSMLLLTDVSSNHADLPEPVSIGTCAPRIKIGVEGAEFDIAWSSVTENWSVVDVWLRSIEPLVLISFPISNDHIKYCPSGLEHTPVTISFGTYKPAQLFLPLANGFIEIGPKLAVIKDLGFVHVAGCVSKELMALQFIVAGAQRGAEFHWRFHIFEGGTEDAVHTANQINSI